MVIRTQGTQKEAQVIDISKKTTPILHSDIDYDTTKPEETLRTFISDVRKMLTRYSENKERINQIENELNDLEHYIELSIFKPVVPGYKLYRRLAELRKERRACKNEIDLLQPIWEHFHATEVLNKLSMVQGEVAKTKSAVDNRCYVCRSNIVEEITEDEAVTCCRKNNRRSKHEDEEPEVEVTATAIYTNEEWLTAANVN